MWWPLITQPRLWIYSHPLLICAGVTTTPVCTTRPPTSTCIVYEAIQLQTYIDLTPFCFSVHVMLLKLRPYYLMDLRDEIFDGDITHVEIRGDINGQLFPEDHTPLFNMEYDAIQQWSIAGTEAHPTHLHVQHFQLQDDTPQVCANFPYRLLSVYMAIFVTYVRTHRSQVYPAGM